MSHKWLILASLGIGTFMSALDGSVVNTILPIIQRNLKCNSDTLQWVVTIYLLVVSGLLLTVGRFGDLLGHRKVCVWGFFFFVLGSLGCGASPHISTLIAARAVQAFGAAMIFATAPAILTTAFPPEQLGLALGLQATMTYLGLATGPSLGGWLTDALGWQSVFFINVPVGAVALAACRWFVPIAPPTNHGESFDRLGAGVFLVGLTLLLLTLNQGHAWGWTSPLVISLFVVSFMILAAFVFVERRVRFPMLDLSLFRLRLFSAAAASAVLNYMSTAMVTFLMPFYLIKQLHWSPSRAGLLLTAQPLVMAIAAPLSGTVSDRLGDSRAPAALGMSILTCGLWWLSCLNGVAADWPHAVIGLTIVGLGTGMFISPNNSALMGSAPANRRGIAAGVMSTARNVGMMFGVGLAGAVLTTMEVLHRTLLYAVTMTFTIAAVVAGVGVITTLVRGEAE